MERARRAPKSSRRGFTACTFGAGRGDSRRLGGTRSGPGSSASLPPSFFRIAKSIGSDHTLAGLLVRIAEEVELDGELRQRYLRVADRVGSDHEHDRVVAALGVAR